ncbi:uncharacterized protein [Cardiocondyla obscurior]|uniref:uncharacterized protein n=1 Tax=Cardiocondyla obscurior TaxID=286306 RepID=UPI0039656A53
MAPTTADAPDDLSTGELMKELAQLGQSTTGSRAVLRERLRKALAGESSQIQEFDGDVATETDEAGISTMTKDQLVQKLRDLGLPVTGTKATLRKRLQDAMLGIDNREDEEDPDERNQHGRCEGENAATNLLEFSNSPAVNNERNVRRPLAVTRRANATGMTRLWNNNREDSNDQSNRNRDEIFSGRTMLSFKDVEEAMTSFSGDGIQNVKRWFETFEETAELCRWTDEQKVIYVKRLLRGSAKLFVNFECRALSYRVLRVALIQEFGGTFNSRQVHKEMGALSKKTDETCQEYIYRALELASHAEMEVESKIQYIIDGIKDEEVNKSILYGATTIKELRQLISTVRNNS